MISRFYKTDDWLWNSDRFPSLVTRYKMSLRTTKPTIRLVRPAKCIYTQYGKGLIYSKTCVRQPPLKLTLVVDVERWLSYKGTCLVIFKITWHVYLYKTDNFFPHQPLFKVSLEGGSLTQVLLYPSLDSSVAVKALANSKYFDQTARMRMLIWVFVCRTSLIVGFVVRWLKW